MSFQTITLNEVDYIMDGKKENRKAHDGVFKGCLYEINTNYMGEDLTTQDIEILILEEYKLKEIAFETYDTFQHYFKNCWNKHFLKMRQNVLAAVDFETGEHKEIIKEKLTNENKVNSSNNGITKFSNTPNQYIPENNSFNGLTEISDGTANGEAKTNGTTQRDYEYTKVGNAFEKFINLSKENYNIVYDFINKFSDLFLNTIIIKNFKRWYY